MIINKKIQAILIKFFLLCVIVNTKSSFEINTENLFFGTVSSFIASIAALEGYNSFTKEDIILQNNSLLKAHGKDDNTEEKSSFGLSKETQISFASSIALTAFIIAYKLLDRSISFITA